MLVFFFQAEDGIRDRLVTGVQTCALPIYCVAVELCDPRLENLTNQAWWKNLDIYQVFRKKKAGLLLINLALTAYQKRLADRIGVEAGQEMIRAVELAREKNIRLEVIDRDISTTLHRLVTEVSLWQKFKIVGGLIAGVFR